MRKFVLGTLILLSLSSLAQVNVKDSLAQGWLFNISTSYLLKGGDFADYLGPNFTVGGDLQYKFKSNVILSVGGRYHFADQVKDVQSIFGDIITTRNEVLGLNGEYAPVSFRERGWNTSVDLSYIYNRWGHNANSGALFSVGLGYNAHWIDVRNQLENTPQIQDEYLRGYDRFTQGFVTRQFLGYHHSGNQRTINFTVGFEFMQGFNKNVRAYNYNTRAFDTGSKLDLYYGLRFSWFLPIYDENAQKFYYY